MNTKTWKWFNYKDIFEIRKGKRLTKADMIPGNIPYVGATDSNNGLTARIANNEHLHSANTISVSYNGSIAEAFYQTKEFWATDDVNVLYPKFDLNKEIALFLTTIINREKYRFNYGRKWDKELMEQSQIRLPVIKTSLNKYIPDWKWIADYVKENIISKLQTRAKDVWQNKFNPKSLSETKIKLNTSNWKWFSYDDIFEIKKGKRLTKADMQDGSIPYIGAIDSNNGISAYISNDEHLHQGNTITVSYNGSIAEAFYQTTKFWATDDVNVLYPKFALNRYIAMFLITLIHREKYRFNYGRKWDKELMEASLIKLPAVKIAPNEYEPNWRFMEDYIKSLPYSSCL